LWGLLSDMMVERRGISKLVQMLLSLTELVITPTCDADDEIS
jgi:hypothetical protein